MCKENSFKPIPCILSSAITFLKYEGNFRSIYLGLLSLLIIQGYIYRQFESINFSWSVAWFEIDIAY